MPGRSGGGGRSRSGGDGSRGRGMKPMRRYSTSKSKSPTTTKQKPATDKNFNQPKPTLGKQIVATAAGVAAGNLLAAAIIGRAQEHIPPEVQCEDGKCQIPADDPCAVELKNFIECAYRAGEMNDCDMFNTLLKECRRYTDTYGKKPSWSAAEEK